ncbi:hypothetical protein LCGC14_1313940 [marine sediment metagenome]|uniref:Uncharacterized protein n=1 Tax=marine sediment metagenome TaxID=412755 RepID=A0A0F9KLF9_9ZZZZ
MRMRVSVMSWVPVLCGRQHTRCCAHVSLAFRGQRRKSRECQLVAPAQGRPKHPAAAQPPPPQLRRGQPMIDGCPGRHAWGNGAWVGRLHRARVS